MAASPTFESVFRDVRDGILQPVYYFTGPEDVLKDELARHVIEHALDDTARTFNLDVRSAGDLDGESLHSLLETLPMLAERRVVYLKYLEQWRKNAKVWKVIERYVADPSPTTILIAVHGAGETPNKALSRSACTVAMDPLRPDRAIRWIERQAKRLGFEVNKNAATLLHQAGGGNLLGLATEMAKLASAVEAGTTVDADTVAHFIGMRLGETPDDWVGAVITRQTSRAIRMLDGVLAASGVTAVRLVSQLGTSLVGIRLARVLIDTGTTPRKLQWALFDAIRQSRPPGLGDWKETALRWAEASRDWTTGELELAIRAARDADKALKSTTVTSDRGILTEMVLSFGPRKVAA